MDRLRKQIALASKAYESLQAVPLLRLGHVERRDVAIMRFIYTFDAVWKTARLYMSEIEGIEANSPKTCARASFETGLLSARQTEAALKMADDRNLTVHGYNEPLAEKIFRRIPRHIATLGAWLAALAKGRKARA